MGASGGDEPSLWDTQSQGSTAHEEKIFVSIRVRPLSEKEIAKNDVSDWECINNTTIIFKNGLTERSMFPNSYNFDKVFGCDCTTREVYEEGAKNVALSVVEGINASIFAYGQTSSGKTYTMSGIIEYAVADIYNYIETHTSREFVLKFSAMEIYNEAVRDLLRADSTPCRLLDDPERGTVVERLTEETLMDRDHLQKLLSVCEAQRQIGETSLNETSSRSHQILRLTIESSTRQYLGPENSSTLSATVNFVDLAGSERASQTLSAGTRLKEGCHINRSLLTLGTVIRKLSKGRNGHVPYRDSKLTRILHNSLGGNAKTAIICTMTPARSLVEQSRNTLLFASCAKDVTMSAQVNEVMSDKVLVKHLQRELARLERELRSMGSPSVTRDSYTLLKEKELQIEEMDREIKELTRQRDLAQSQAENLLRVTEVDPVSGVQTESDRLSKSQVQNAWINEYSTSELSDGDSHHMEGNCGTFDISLCPDRPSRYNSNNNYLELPENSEEHSLFDETSPRFSLSTPKFLGLNSCHGWGVSVPRTDKDDDNEDICKEVQCIEMKDSSMNKNMVTDSLLTGHNEKEGKLDLVVTGNEDAALSAREGDRDLNHMHTDGVYVTLKQKIQDMQKTIERLVGVFPFESSPCSTETDLCSSRSFNINRSRSCRAILVTSPSSCWFEKAEQHGKTFPYGLEKDFSGRPNGSRLKLYESKSSTEVGRFYRKNFKSSYVDESVERIERAGEEDKNSVQNFVARARRLSEDLSDDLERVPVMGGSDRNIEDVGLKETQGALQPPANWAAEFERRRREIVELWDACNVPLVHRSYFFLLFQGDPSDSIYMEVELRRLSFLKDKLYNGSQTPNDGQFLTLASSARDLKRERDMLSKQVMKRFSRKEVQELYKNWGIVLETKQRRLQLARRLWTDTKDMDHVKDSASIVAKLVRFALPGETPKEMLGLSLAPRPQPLRRKSFSWKNGMSALL